MTKPRSRRDAILRAGKASERLRRLEDEHCAKRLLLLRNSKLNDQEVKRQIDKLDSEYNPKIQRADASLDAANREIIRFNDAIYGNFSTPLLKKGL